MRYIKCTFPPVWHPIQPCVPFKKMSILEALAPSRGDGLSCWRVIIAMLRLKMRCFEMSLVDDWVWGWMRWKLGLVLRSWRKCKHAMPQPSNRAPSTTFQETCRAQNPARHSSQILSVYLFRTIPYLLEKRDTWRINLFSSWQQTLSLPWCRQLQQLKRSRISTQLVFRLMLNIQTYAAG